MRQASPATALRPDAMQNGATRRRRPRYSSMRCQTTLRAAGDRGDDGDFVAFVEGGVEALEEADVFAVDEEVDEAAEFAAFVDEAFAHAGVGAFELFDEGGEGCAFGTDFGDVVGEVTEGGGDLDGDGP